MQPLLGAGAKDADSRTGAAQGNDLVISMVADAPNVAEVMRIAPAAEALHLAADSGEIRQPAMRQGNGGGIRRGARPSPTGPKRGSPRSHWC